MKLTASRTITASLVLCVLALSCLFVVLAEQVQGAHWLGHNFDNDYPYLLNALCFAQFHSAGHYDHPGTPVQIIGAMVLRVAHAARSTGTAVDQDVCLHPEGYLHAIHLVLVIMVVAALCLLATRFYRVTGAVAGTVLASAVLFVSPTVLSVLPGVNAEIVLIFTALVMQVVLLSMIDGAGARRAPIVALAAVVGFGIATKITFLPFVIVPVMIIPGWRKKARYVLLALASFVVFTLPIINHYRTVARWLLNILTHTGKYGYGSSGILIIPEYLRTLGNLLAAEPMLAAGIASGLLYAAWNWRCRRDNTLRIIAAIALAQLAQLLMVAKHPEQRYLIPALSFVAFAGACILVHARAHYARRAAAFGVAVLVCILVSGAVYARMVITKFDRLQQNAVRLNDLAGKFTNATRVYYFGASSLSQALTYADSYANGRFGKLLARLYGDVYFYDLWAGTYRDFEKSVSLTAIKAVSPGGVVYQGASFEAWSELGGLRPGTGALTKIGEANREALYVEFPQQEK
jgi:hypothetical protein